MSFSDRFNEALLGYIHSKGRSDAVKVTSHYQHTESDGYCVTCYSEWEVVDINYVDADGNEHVYSYSGSMADLINALD